MIDEQRLREIERRQERLMGQTEVIELAGGERVRLRDLRLICEDVPDLVAEVRRLRSKLAARAETRVAWEDSAGMD